MKLHCVTAFSGDPGDEVLPVLLYDQAGGAAYGSAGAALAREVRRRKLVPASRAWDFLSLAMAVVAADASGHRNQSPDGWTRELDIDVAVSDPTFWTGQQEDVEAALSFLTTDLWRVRFSPNGYVQPEVKKPEPPDCGCVALLSGGMDSLVGAIDLNRQGRKVFAVSHTVRGDASNQATFASQIGSGLDHLALNHNVRVPDPEKPPSQRSRSMAFLAYGVLAATALKQYATVETIPLFVCENGFISVNPPLTRNRVGSLSTRTTHPVFLKRVQAILDAADLRVRLENPYQLSTKGEMLANCANQVLLEKLAVESTSCGRFQRYGNRHCGRCVPCQVRRAAFLRWGKPDETEYLFDDLGKDDEDHAAFDDVRAVASALIEAKAYPDRWLAGTLNSAVLGDVAGLKTMVGRGLAELAALHKHYHIK